MTRTVTLPRLDAGEEGIFHNLEVEINYHPGLGEDTGGWLDRGDDPLWIEDWDVKSFHNGTYDRRVDLDAWIETHEQAFVDHLFDALDD